VHIADAMKSPVEAKHSLAGAFDEPAAVWSPGNGGALAHREARWKRQMTVQ
jgi:hypothetical protein